VNKRIQELADQAKVLDYSTWDSYNQKTIDHYKFDKEKFAQLIVQECGQWIINNAGAMEHLGPEYFAKAMIKDFGVES
jgi:hypothetical protein